MVIPNVPQPMFNAKSQRGAFGARDRSPEDLFKLDLKKITNKHKQGIFSTTLDDLHFNWKLPFPDHIKIDVDGIEHLILQGAQKFLADKKINNIKKLIKLTNFLKKK